MKLHNLFSAWLTAVSAALALAGGSALRAAPATEAAASGAGTNAVSHEVVIPKAIFDLTTPPIKDPFFPLSSRRAIKDSTTNAPPTFNASMFNLKALSGGPRQRLALINNHTLAEGESVDFNTIAGKVLVHCVAIHSDSVTIRLEGQPDTIELHFKDADSFKSMFRDKDK